MESSGDFNRRLIWSIDGELIVEKKSARELVALERKDDGKFAGTVNVQFSTLGRPRRATMYDEAVSAILDVGGVELAPEPGSAAAMHHEKVLAHPGRYVIFSVLGGVAKVGIPLLIAALLALIVVTIPWPDINLPDIPLPDLPSIPWPDIRLPDIPWPDVSLPGWLAWILDHAKYVWPVIVAYVLARAELKRRRKHAAEMDSQRSGSVEPKSDDDTDVGRTPKD